MEIKEIVTIGEALLMSGIAYVLGIITVVFLNRDN